MNRPTDRSLVDERVVRAAAGLTMAAAAVAFAYAFLGKRYLPIQSVTAFFLLEFGLRVGWGLDRSPVGRLASAMVRGGTPQWVSVAPKRFAWSLGMAMSAVMTAITQAHIRGLVPMTICRICLTLMWLEAVLGLCLGCLLHRQLVQRGLRPPVPDQVCADGACTVEAAAGDPRVDRRGTDRPTGHRVGSR